MSNKEIYCKTISFSLRRVLWDVLAFIGYGAIMVLGFMIGDKAGDHGLGGLLIAGIVGLIVLVFFLKYISYTYKAGQIAMMTRAVTEGSLPENVVAEGKKVVKERFLTVAAYYAATRIIKGIFNQIGKGITAVGEAVGGDSGSTVASVISSAIQTLVSYLCDCCLGWVFFRSEVNSGKATCEGAVLFFRHGKTLAKNVGRIFGMGIVSLIVIGGVFFGIFYAIFAQFPAAFEAISAEFAETAAEESNWLIRMLSEPKTAIIAAAIVAGVIMWSILHSTFVRPFILTGVLRNYLESGMRDIPTEDSFDELDGRSAKFKKLHGELETA